MTKSRDLGNLAQTVAVNLPTSLGTAGQTLVVNSGENGLEFGAASGGGSMTVYNDINGTDGTPSGYTYLTNASSPSDGDLAFVTANNTVYVRASSGWRKIATVQEAPSAVTGHSSNYPDIGLNATTDITLSTTDPEGFDVTWSYVVGGNGTLSGSNINNSEGDTLASISVQTANANSGGTNTITYRITRETTSIAGNFTITFTATDSQSTGTSDTGAISFVLSFIVTNSKHTSLLMATDGSAGDNSTITYDTGSTTGNSFTQINNDIHAGTFSSYRHGGYSNHFDGSGDFLAIANDAGFGFGTGSWTFETWLYCTKSGASNAIFDLRVGTGNQTGAFGIGMLSNGQVQMFSSDFNGAFYKPSETLSFNEWQHLAVVKDASANETQMYFNGTATSLTHSDTKNYGSSQPVQIAKDDWTNYFGGYLRDLRVVKGTAVYSGNFTPPTGPLTTTGGEYSSTTNVNTSITASHTSLLTCQLPYFKDGSSNDHSITLNSDPRTKPFGPYDYNEYNASSNGGSILVNAYNQKITLADSSSNFSLGTTETTIKLWYYPMDSDSSSASWLMRKGTSSSTVGYWALGHYSSNRLRYLIKDNGGNLLSAYSSNNSIIPNTWNYIEWYQPTSGNGSIKVNGTEVISTGYASNYGTNTNDVYLCNNLAANPSNGMYFADFQFVKGDARESSVPTSPMSTNTNAKLHIKGQQGHVIDKSQSVNLKLVNDAEAVTDAPNNSTISSTNALSLDGTGDYVTATGIPIGAGDFTLEAWVRPASFANYRTIFTNRGTSNASTNFVLGVNSSGQVYLWSSSFLITSSSTLSANTWHHVALVRNGTGTGSTVLYIDGSSVGSANVSNNFSDTAYDIGGDTVDTNHWNGYIQDLRVSIGKARYTSNFTVPSSPLKA